MLANVIAETVVLAKGLVALGFTAVTEALCFAVSGAPWSLFGWYMLLGVVGALPVILLSLVVGLASRDQMTAGLYSVPVLLLALAPVFGGFSPDIRAVVRFAPHRWCGRAFAPGHRRRPGNGRGAGALSRHRRLARGVGRGLQAPLPPPSAGQLASRCWAGLSYIGGFLSKPPALGAFYLRYPHRPTSLGGPRGAHCSKFGMPPGHRIEAQPLRRSQPAVKLGRRCSR